MREIFRCEISCEKLGQNGPFYTTLNYTLVYFDFWQEIFLYSEKLTLF